MGRVRGALVGCPDLCLWILLAGLMYGHIGIYIYIPGPEKSKISVDCAF